MAREGILLVGTGFLGRAVATRFAGSGLPLYALARRTGAALPGARHTVVLEAAAELQAVLSSCATVLHLASATTPSSSAGQPMLELVDNVTPALRLLEALQPHPEIHLIYVSTGGALYGDIGSRAATESDAVAPRSFHGAGKAAIESFLAAEAAQSGRPLTILRPSNLYGPGQPLRAGFGVIRTMLEHLRQGTVLPIFGDGETVRDYVYIDDMAEACVRFIALRADRGTYNVGTGVGHSLNELRGIAERICGRTLRIAHVGAREVDLRHAVLDAARLRQRLGWGPSTALQTGIRSTWDWLCAQ